VQQVQANLLQGGGVSTRSWCRIYIQDEDATDVRISYYDQLLAEMSEYASSHEDTVIELVTVEGHKTALLVSRITGIMTFTPETRRKYSEITWELLQEKKENRMEIGGPDFAERDD
jgi:hypothetical protein